MKEKALCNLNDFITRYYKRLKKAFIKEQSLSNGEIEPYNSEIQQLVLEYDASIYKNMANKKIEFDQLFKNKNKAYSFKTTETEILKNYIGIYNDGEKQSINSIAKKLQKSPSTIDITLKKILIHLLDPVFQKKLLDERNKKIKNNTSIKEKIKNEDITFLNITENFIDILRLENINTINDLLEIDNEKLKDMNIKHGYDSERIIFPKRIVEEIHSLGLIFKNDEIFEKMYENDIEFSKETQLRLKMQFKSVIDILSAKQFEPELLNILDPIERLDIEKQIGEAFIDKVNDYNDEEELEEIDIDYLSRIEDYSKFELKINNCDKIFELENKINYQQGKNYYMNKN